MKNKRLETVVVEKRKNIAIIGVEKKSGETLEFSKENPGRIHNDRIVGKVERETREEIEIDRTNIKATKIDEKGNISEFATRDGKVYKVLIGSLHEENDKFIFTAIKVSHESISIPLSDVYLIKVVEFNVRNTFTLIGGILALGILSFVFLIGAIVAGSAGASD